MRLCPFVDDARFQSELYDREQPFEVGKRRVALHCIRHRQDTFKGLVFLMNKA
jgi:hypothetical protein